MKAITIWQPWASSIVSGAKSYETRSWATKYRGPIAIHAAKKPYLPIIKGLPDDVKAVLNNIFDFRNEILHTGAIIATAELVNVWYICNYPGPDIDIAKHINIGAESITTNKHDPNFGAFFIPTMQEMALGDWTPGRYAWELKNIKGLPEPVPAKGQQGLWNWEG